MPTRGDIAKVSGTTPDQRALWRAAAGGGDRDFSSWARDALDAAARGTSDLPPRSAEAAALRAELAALRRDLNRGIGNLLDQLATRLHRDALAGRAGDAFGVRPALDQAQAEVESLRLTVARGLAALLPKRPQ